MSRPKGTNPGQLHFRFSAGQFPKRGHFWRSGGVGLSKSLAQGASSGRRLQTCKCPAERSQLSPRAIASKLECHAERVQEVVDLSEAGSI